MANASFPPTALLASCKWFDATRGFGFLKPLGTPQPDVFVHAIDLKAAVCERPQLITGEYVQYELGPAMEGKRAKAINVRGIMGGPLMCDHGRVTFRSYFKDHATDDKETTLTV